MTPQELKQLILSDEQALAFAGSGNYTECAIRCESIASPKIVNTFIGELGFFGLYQSPLQAEAVMQKIEAVAQVNPVVNRLLKWVQPGAPGVNFGDSRVRYMLTLPMESGGLGFTSQEALPLLEAAETKRRITIDMVAEAWRS